MPPAHQQVMTATVQPRLPAGTPHGGRFTSTGRPESGLELNEPTIQDVWDHPAMRIPGGDANTETLLAVLAETRPNPEDSTPATLTRAQADLIVGGHLSHLGGNVWAEQQLRDIDEAADRLAAAEALDPEHPHIDSLDAATAAGIDWEDLRADYTTETDALVEYRRELVDYWAANLHGTVRNAVEMGRIHDPRRDVLPWGAAAPAGAR